jgi:hypothetical protein
MPRCRDCQQVLATAELRRLPRGFRCKDAADCQRRRERAEARKQLALFEEAAR